MTKNYFSKPKVKSKNIYTKRQCLKLLDKAEMMLRVHYEYDNIRNEAYHNINSILKDLKEQAHKIKV
jgi:hypothetical protein